MALQDLTPQLRTRLSRMERAVGWFVILATAMLVFGFGYYIFQLAQRKGWFTPKFKYQTGLNNAAGLKPGQPVKLMGNDVGEITAIVPNQPDAFFGMTVYFTVLKPHYGYVWDDSKVKVSSDFLGNRFLEITKGAAGVPTVAEDTNKAPQAMLRWEVARDARKKVIADLHAASPDLARTNGAGFDWMVMDQLKRLAQSEPKRFYTNLTEVYWINPEESPALNERLERVANQIEQALPTILNLTNQLATVLSNSAVLTANLNDVALHARPAVSNLALFSAQLNRPGALGELLLPTNLNTRLDAVLGDADLALLSANTNLETLDLTLIHLADLTSNLNHQVQMNSNILGGISTMVVDTDDLVQGLKRHWLLRSAFKKPKTNKPPEKVTSPKM